MMEALLRGQAPIGPECQEIAAAIVRRAAAVAGNMGSSLQGEGDDDSHILQYGSATINHSA